MYVVTSCYFSMALVCTFILETIQGGYGPVGLLLLVDPPRLTNPRRGKRKPGGHAGDGDALTG